MKLYFDLDGTLFQTEITVLAAARVFFDELQLQYPGDKEILSHVGRPMKVFMRNIMGGRAVLDDDLHHFRSIEHEMLRRQGKLFDGIKAMLTSLKKDAIRLTTGWRRDRMISLSSQLCMATEAMR